MKRFNIETYQPPSADDIRRVTRSDNWHSAWAIGTVIAFAVAVVVSDHLAHPRPVIATFALMAVAIVLWGVQHVRKTRIFPGQPYWEGEECTHQYASTEALAFVSQNKDASPHVRNFLARVAAKDRTLTQYEANRLMEHIREVAARKRREALEKDLRVTDRPDIRLC